MVGRCCDAVPRLIIKSCRERSCSNTSTHRHTLSLTTRTHTRQGQLPQIRLLPAAVEFPPLSPLCALLSSRTMEWKPLPPQQPPAAPSSPKSWNLGHTADMSAARGLLAAGSIRKQSTQRSPFSWGSPPALLQPLQPQRPPTRRYMCMCDMCVCVHCAGRCKKLSSLPEPKLCIVREPRRIEAVRPRKVAARFAAPPWGRCDRQAHVCVSASDAR